MPMNEQNGTTSSDSLNGWKDIAGYLGRSVRCVQRWEREIGLPVRRIRNSDGQTVYAAPTEIDEWRKSRDLPKPLPEDTDCPNEDPPPPLPAASQTAPGPQFKWVWLTVGAFALLATGLLGGYYLNRLGPLAASIQTAGTEVIGYDAFGRIIWHHAFGEQISHADGEGNAAAPRSEFVDLDGDGRSEAVFAVRYSEPGRPAVKSDSLVAFDRRGVPRWTFTPDLNLSCGGADYSGPWQIYDTLITRTSGKPRIFIAVNHHTWWPGLVLELDTEGHAHTRLLQTGWVRGLGEWKTDQGHFVAVAGVSNEYSRPTVNIFDIDGPPAMMPYSAARFSCRDAPTAPPAAVFILPNFDLLDSSPYAFAANPIGTDQGLKVRIDPQAGGVVAWLSADFHSASLSLSDGYWNRHRQLESEGAIKHSAEACPVAVTPQPVDIWNRTRGWIHTLITPVDLRTDAKAIAR